MTSPHLPHSRRGKNQPATRIRAKHRRGEDRDPPPQIALVIPCFNEKKRIKLGRFRTALHEGYLRFLFVDDGSNDGTGKLLQTNQSAAWHVMRLPVNQGKAEAVRQGMLQAEKKFPKAQWIGFWDADQATPLPEVIRMIQYERMQDRRYDAVWASRVLRAGSRIRRSIFRHYAGRVFATFARWGLGVGTYDTQCGAKLFRRSKVIHLFRRPFLSPWIFDLEIVMRIPHGKLLEYPLGEWRDVPGSKLRIFRHGTRVLVDLFRIVKKHRIYPRTS